MNDLETKSESIQFFLHKSEKCMLWGAGYFHPLSVSQTICGAQLNDLGGFHALQYAVFLYIFN